MGSWRLLNPEEAEQGALPLYAAHGDWTCRGCKRSFPCRTLPPVMRWRDLGPGVTAHGPGGRWTYGFALCAHCAEGKPDENEEDVITRGRVVQWSPDPPEPVIW